MQASIIALTLAYAGLALLLLNLGFFTRWPAWVKIAAVIGVSGLYWVTFDALRGLQGWPTEERLPERFALLAAVINEPDKETGDKGSIHVWVNAIDNGRPVAQPRAYTLPYGKDLHSLFADAMKKVRQGVSQIGVTEPDVGSGKSSVLKVAGSKSVPKLKVVDQPTPQLPEK